MQTVCPNARHFFAPKYWAPTLKQDQPSRIPSGVVGQLWGILHISVFCPKLICSYGQSVWGSMGSDRFPNVIYASVSPNSVSKQDSRETLSYPDKTFIEDSSSSELDERSRKLYIPNDDEEFIDPLLSNYPIPLVAKTVDLHNDDT